VGANKDESVGGDKSESVGGSKTEEVSGKKTETVAKEYSVKAKKVSIEADDEIALRTGDATILMKKSGDISIKGKKISVTGSGDIVLKGKKILEN
jgi:type VI secretion system secreted protein VgrG